MDDAGYKTVCDESWEDNVNLKNNTTIPVNSCHNYTNHTDVYLECEFKLN